MELQNIQVKHLLPAQIRANRLVLSSSAKETNRTLTRDKINLETVLSGTSMAVWDRSVPLGASGRLVWRAEKLVKLGAKASNQVGYRLIDR